MGSIIGRMKPAVQFWHIPKLITEYNHPRQRDQIALHRVTNLTVMRRGKELFGWYNHSSIDNRESELVHGDKNYRFVVLYYYIIYL
jgi:hypothetical protein